MCLIDKVITASGAPRRAGAVPSISGTSAIKICMLLLRYLQLASRFGWSMSNLVALLRMNLFTHRDLMAWVNEPFAVPGEPQESPQAALAYA